MAANTLKLKLPKGFILDKEPNLPPGFILDMDMGSDGRLATGRPAGGLAGQVRAPFDQEELLVRPKTGLALEEARYGHWGAGYMGLPRRAYPKSETMRTMAQAGGGIVGGMAGAAVGHPLLGAGLGGATAESLYQLGEHVVAPEVAPKTPWEAGKKIGWAGGREMLEEGLARAVIRVGAPFAKKIARKPKTKEIINYLKRYRGKLTPAQATESRALDILENVAESSILGGGRIFEFKKGQDVLIDVIANDIATRFGTGATKEQAGEVIQAIIKNKTEAFRKVGSGLYTRVDELTKGTMISTKPLKKEATRMLKQITPSLTQEGKVALRATRGKTLMPSLANKNTVRMLRDFQNLPDAVPFSYLNQWRSDLLQVGYAPSDLIPGKTAGTAKHLANKIDGLFKQVEGGLTGESAQALEAANAYWKLGKERFNSVLIKRLVKRNPEYVLSAFVKRGNVTDIQEIKKLIGSGAWEDVKGAYIQELLFTQAKDVSGTLSGKKLQNILTKMTPETMEEIFGKAGSNELQLFANTAMAIQQRAAGGGGMLIQLTQAGAILSVPAWIVGGKPGVGAGMTTTVLLGPYALGRVFTNPTGIKWLTEGLTTRAGTKEAIRLAPRIIRIIGKEALTADKAIQRDKELRAPSLQELRGFGGRGF